MKKSKSYKYFLFSLANAELDKSFAVGRSLVFGLLTIFLCNGTLYFLASISGYGDELTDHISSLNFTFSWFAIIVVGVIFPAIEEFTFRLGLSLKRSHILISISAIYAFFVGFIFLVALGKSIENQFFLIIGLNIFLFVKAMFLLSIPITNYGSIASKFTSLSSLSRKHLCYASSFLFSLYHILLQNYYKDVAVVSSILLGLSYFISGLVFGTIRILHGIVYAIILHGVLNVLSFL